MKLKVSEYLLNLAEYSPKPVKYNAKLSANESPYDLPDNIKKKIFDEFTSIEFNRYPNARATEVREAASKYYGVDVSQIMPANGSGEWVKILMADLLEKNSKILFLDPDFFIYRRQAGFAGKEIVYSYKDDDGTASADKIIEAVKKEKPDGFIFSNPCNPTGQGWEEDDVKRIIEACGDSLCIVDEAYMDFFGRSIIDYAVTKENVIVLRTCSKAIGLAAARLGFAIANEKLIGLINKIRSPYSVNAFAQAVGKVVFSDLDYVRGVTQKIVDEREKMYQGFEKLMKKYPDKINVLPSKSNFFFARIKDSENVDKFLLEKGIKIRDWPKYGYSRINVGTAEENGMLMDALDELWSK